MGGMGSEGGNIENSEFELSLTSERENLEKLRDNIPKEVRESNDSLKEILKQMGELKIHPQKVRENFDKMQRKQRTIFQKAQKKSREAYTKEEAKNRESFLKQQKALRDKSRKEDMDRDQRSEFYNELDLRRREFFSEQRDKRKEFESELKEKNNDFYHNLTTQRKEFNEEWKSYNTRWQEWQRNKKSKPLTSSERSSSNSFFSPQEAAEFDRLRKLEGQRQRLSTEDN